MTDQSLSDSPVPIIKEETVKDDGRILIYYTFPDDRDAPPASAAQEDAHV